jgi:hypothetical protein
MEAFGKEMCEWHDKGEDMAVFFAARGTHVGPDV